MSLHLHFDAFNGISGDMMLGALVDLGVSVDSIREGLAGLPIGEFDLVAEPVKRSGIVGTRVRVVVEEEPHPHAHLRHIVEKVEAAGLPPAVSDRSIAAFRLLAEAEAHVHGSTPEKIHFHEVGAKDAIVDIAGSMLGVHLLGAAGFSAEPVVVGTGSVECAHGIMPVPAPATAQILRNFPLRSSDLVGEMTTPTGAAILQVLTEGRPRPGGFRSTQIGYGAGSREIPGHPNYLRLTLGESRRDGLPLERESIVELEAEMDDMTPELSGHLLERLFEAGARDAHFVPAFMKKNRPGIRLTVLCDDEHREVLAGIIFRESSTFGLRVRTGERYCLRRRTDRVETPWGPVGVKIGMWGDEVLKITPEYEDCRELARRAGLPLREIYSTAVAAIQARFGRKPEEPGKDAVE